MCCIALLALKPGPKQASAGPGWGTVHALAAARKKGL